MRFASGISDAVNATAAGDQVCRQVTEQLAGASCDFVCVFASTIYRTYWPDLLARINQQLSPRVLIGCSGGGIIGGERELEWVPAISMVAAHLPSVRLFPFLVVPEELEMSTPGGFWIDKVGVSPEANPVFVVCADPYTCRPEKLVNELSATYPGRPMVGGLVSGGNEPGEHFIFMGTEVHREGAVGVAMTGDITMDTIISQGCRPIGRAYIVTESNDNLICRLGGRQALAVLHEALLTLSPEDRDLAQQGAIVVGTVMNEMRPRFSAGDFLIRQIIGLDPNLGGIAVADTMQVGQTVQFHLRDASTSREELRRMLARTQQGVPHDPPAGALMFNCLSRGKAFYGMSHHDIKAIHTFKGKLPVGGFFCNGEIAPVGGTNFLHGYTASVGFFRPSTKTARRHTTPATP